jgi:hypothetical protein
MLEIVLRTPPARCVATDAKAKAKSGKICLRLSNLDRHLEQIGRICFSA